MMGMFGWTAHDPKTACNANDLGWVAMGPFTNLPLGGNAMYDPGVH